MGGGRYPGAALIAAVAACLAGAALTGCASVPVESVELSAAMGRDLETLHAAHKELAVRYFQRMHQDVDEFVRDVYRPFVIRSAMEDLGLVAKLEASLQPGADLEPMDVLEIFVEEAMRQVESYRMELQAPVNEQERTVLGAIDAAHLQIQNANAIVTGHLASVRKVHDAQGEFLRQARLGGLPERTISIVTSVSDELSRALATAQTTEAELEVLPQRISEIMKRIRPATPPGTSPDSDR